MNKIKIIAMISLFLIFIQKVGLAQELPNDYQGLLKEYQSLREDRDNVLAQTKRLLEEKNNAADLETAMNKLQDEKKAVELEKEELSKKISALDIDFKQSQGSNAQIAKERDEIKVLYDKLNAEGAIKELNDQIAVLQKTKDKLGMDLKQSGKDLEYLSAKQGKLGIEKDKLSADLEEYKKKYNEAAKKNAALEKEMVNIPKKFSEIARQNKALLKETSQMHYNLGVFYTKAKEYSRAVAEFKKALEINPDDAGAHFNLGYIYAEYLVDRKKAVEHFQHFLRLEKGDDKDADWVRKYILTWETYEGRKPMD